MSQFDEGDANLTENDLLLPIESMKSNKISSNNGKTKKFYQIFWKEVKTSLIKSFLFSL